MNGMPCHLVSKKHNSIPKIIEDLANFVWFKTAYGGPPVNLVNMRNWPDSAEITVTYGADLTKQTSFRLGRVRRVYEQAEIEALKDKPEVEADLSSIPKEYRHLADLCEPGSDDLDMLLTIFNEEV
jgi:hypothetical protein